MSIVIVDSTSPNYAKGRFVCVVETPGDLDKMAIFDAM